LRSGEIIAGLVSSSTAIRLAMAFGMFAFVPLGDEYFAYGAMAGLLSAVIAGVVSVVLGSRSSPPPGQPARSFSAAAIRAPRSIL